MTRATLGEKGHPPGSSYCASWLSQAKAAFPWPPGQHLRQGGRGDDVKVPRHKAPQQVAHSSADDIALVACQRTPLVLLLARVRARAWPGCARSACTGV